MQNFLICFYTNKDGTEAKMILKRHFPFGKIVFKSSLSDFLDNDILNSNALVLYVFSDFEGSFSKDLTSLKYKFQKHPLTILIADDNAKPLQKDPSVSALIDMHISSHLGLEALVNFVGKIPVTDSKYQGLLESERKYNTLVDILPGITYRCKIDSDWTMLFLSSKMAKLSGFPARDFIKNRVRTFSDIILPQDREHVWLSVHKAIGKKLSFKVEYRIQTATGRTKWVQEYGRAVKDMSGEDILEGVIMDIDLMKNREMRQEIMHELTLALSTTNDLIELIDIIKAKVGKATNTRNLMLALYDRVKRRFKIPFVDEDQEYFKTFPLGKTLNALVINRNRPVFYQEGEILKLSRQGKINLPNPVPKVWLGVPLQIHGKASGIIVVQDFDDEYAIHETDKALLKYVSVQIAVSIIQKQAEDENNKLLQAIEQNPGSVKITDLDGHIIYSNRRSTKMSGWDQNELTGKLPNILNPVANDPELVKKIWAALNQKGVWRGEFENKTKSNKSYWEYALISAIKNHSGKTTHYAYVKEDITKRKKIEQELLKAKKRAEESDKLKTTFLSNISYEIRTPMNAMIGFAEMLNSHEYSPLDHEQFIGMILENSKKLLATIDDIIDIAKIETGALKILSNQCSANKILYDNYYTFEKRKEKLGKEHIQLITKQYKENENLLFESDAQRINQVMWNILENAFKFTYEGIIEIGYTLIEQDGQQMIDFYVKDNAPKLPPGQGDAIFDHLAQNTDIYTNTSSGTGLGLAISRNIAHLMHGDIRYEANEGGGSTFHFIFPFVAYKQKEIIENKADEDKNQEFNWPGKTIMIAEDEDSNFQLLDVMLRKTHATIKRTFNGKQAVEFVKGGNDVDLVLMDVRMPVMNGYEATEYIKEFNPDLPVIIQTAYAMSGDRKNSFEAGCDDYLTKPIRATELYAILKRFLD